MPWFASKAIPRTFHKASMPLSPPQLGTRMIIFSTCKLANHSPKSAKELQALHMPSRRPQAWSPEMMATCVFLHALHKLKRKKLVHSATWRTGVKLQPGLGPEVPCSGTLRLLVKACKVAYSLAWVAWNTGLLQPTQDRTAPARGIRRRERERERDSICIVTYIYAPIRMYLRIYIYIHLSLLLQ